MRKPVRHFPIVDKLSWHVPVRTLETWKRRGAIPPHAALEMVLTAMEMGVRVERSDLVLTAYSG